MRILQFCVEKGLRADSAMADDEKMCCVLNKAHVELHGREPPDAISLCLFENNRFETKLCVCVCVCVN